MATRKGGKVRSAEECRRRGIEDGNACVEANKHLIEKYKNKTAKEAK